MCLAGVETENGYDYVASNIVDEHGNAEGCFGNVPFKNEVVFTKYPKGLHVASAAGNTAEAVFPQNMLSKRNIHFAKQINPIKRNVFTELAGGKATKNKAVTFISEGKVKLV